MSRAICRSTKLFPNSHSVFTYSNAGFVSKVSAVTSTARTGAGLPNHTHYGVLSEPELSGVGNSAGLPLTVKVRTRPPTVRSPDDQGLLASIHEGLEASAQVGLVRLTSAAPESFRTVILEPSLGRVSLVEGGANVENWEALRAKLRAMMESTSDSTVYGLLKRGSYRPAAESGYSLSQDWPEAEHHEPATQLGQAFEAEYAPDAFGVQLLGAGYEGRIPAGSDWTSTPWLTAA